MQRLAAFSSSVPSASDYRHTLINLTPLKTMTPEAEKFNGWAAMLGFVAAVGAYATTGQLIPGLW